MKKTILMGAVLSTAMLAGCSSSDERQTSSDESVGMPNPAAVHCESKGGTHEIQRTNEGDIGICHLPDGTSVDAWQLYRDDVGQPQK